IAVRAVDDEVLLLGPLHPAPDRVLDHLGLAGDPEEDRPLLLVGSARGLELLQVFPVEGAALALPVGAARSADLRALVPVQPQPSQAVVDDVEEGLAVARLVGVLDPQDEGAAGVPRVEPVEERGAGAADVEESGRTGGEADADRRSGWE